MGEYLFLYFIGFAAVLFAVIQDVRTREIANWLTFSLVAFVLAYRAFYSIYSNDFMFFIYGLAGVLFFVGLGYLFYYSKVFAGGDAKLLFGLGGIFPYSSLIDYVYYGLGFVLLLFTAGVFYTLIYSLFMVRDNYYAFKKDFFKNMRSRRYLFIVSFLLGAFIYFINLNYIGFFALLGFSIFVFLFPMLFAYVKAIESSCMIKMTSPDKLTEGDWLERDIYVGSKMIKKNFAGLTMAEIGLLRKAGKKVMIKLGVPFAPAFLIGLCVFLAVLRNSSF